MPWEDQHDHIILREIIATSLSARTTLYAHPDLAEFAGNGGDKINKRLQVVLGKLEKCYGVSGMVKEEVGRKRSEKGAGGRVPKGTPKAKGAGVAKGKGTGKGHGGAGGKGKKDVKVEEQVESEDHVDQDEAATGPEFKKPRGKKRKIELGPEPESEDGEIEQDGGDEGGGEGEGKGERGGQGEGEGEDEG